MNRHYHVEAASRLRDAIHELEAVESDFREVEEKRDALVTENEEMKARIEDLERRLGDIPDLTEVLDLARRLEMALSAIVDAKEGEAA